MNDHTVVVADDHPLFRAAMLQAVGARLPGARILEAESLQGLQDCLATVQDVDLLLLDLHMPGASGFSGLAFIARRYPDVPVLMVSADEDRNIIDKALELGAAGFIPKSASIDTIGEAMEAVLAGESWLPPDLDDRDGSADVSQQEMARRVAELTPQQYRVLKMIADGMLNKQIAFDLEVSEATVKAHVTAIMRKLDVRTRTQAVLALTGLDLKPPHQR